MLATMNNRDSQRVQPTETVDIDDRLCPGCKLSAVTEQGGLVVAFGQSFFHVDCFKCAKCGDQVTADTNLLLLSDGSPICANCSYSCNVCHNPILDEAIMTGDDSYHAHCFKCKVCKNRIDELVFAKTSQGIYCMKCHNERMIKIRKHTQKKAEREKAAGAQSSTSSRDRDVARNRSLNNLAYNDPPVSSASTTTPMTPRTRGPDAVRSPPRQRDGPYVSDAFEANDPSYQRQNAAAGLPSPSFRVAPPDVGKPPSRSASASAASVFHPPPVDARPNMVKKNTLPLLPNGTEEGHSDSRRKSFDDGVRPLNALFPRAADSAPAPSGLSASTSRQDKRRSTAALNPDIPLDDVAPSPPPSSSPALSPHSATFRSGSRPSTPRDHSRTPSPKPGSTSRPDSASSNTHLSYPSSPRTPPDSSQDQTVVLSPHSLPNVILDSVPPRKNSHTTRPSQDGRLSVSSIPSRRSVDNQDGYTGSDTGHSRPPSRSRATTPSSPSHRVDVPYGVESGTDTDAEDSSQSSPPPLPPKELRTPLPTPLPTATMQAAIDQPDDADTSTMSHQDSSDDMSESSPVEHTSRATFIAPALPPIRFSMTTADFSDLFHSADGQSSLKSSLDQLAKISEDYDVSVPKTPPPTAASASYSAVTPTNNATKFPVAPPLNRSVSDDGHISTASGEDRGAPRFVSPAPRYHSLPKKPPTVSTDESTESLDSFAESTTVGSSVRSRSSLDSQSLAHQTSVTVTPAGSVASRNDPAGMVTLRLQEALTDARERGAHQLKLDRGFVEAILAAMESRDTDYMNLKNKFDGVKRASKQYIDGLTVAQTEYDSELKARRDAEAEVTRLRVLLSGQAVQLTTLSGDTRRHELREQMSKELSNNLSDLEHDLSKLRVERDMALAEVEELSATKSSAIEAPSSNLGRSLTTRLDTIKKQYQRDLIPLKEQREMLAREVAELKGVRDVFLEETTVLNARNEELAKLSAQYTQRMLAGGGPETPRKPQSTPLRSQHSAQYLSPSASGSGSDEGGMDRLRAQKSEAELPTPSRGKPFIKWPGSRPKEAAVAYAPAPAPVPVPAPAPSPEPRTKATATHNFQQLSILRFTRCDHCADKMWGSQLRCSACNISVHVRCVNHVQVTCSNQSGPAEDDTPLPPSMFGRDLSEQVQADAQREGGDREVPVIVEKCIDAVETLAMDYEGIYRKTGGSGQSKAITQLFERGDYAAFDLRDSDRFNDVCSVTSVLKTYFRSLPVPLLTFDLHDHFMSAVQIRESATKNKSLLELVNKLPAEHYYTLRMLMLHLHRVHEKCEKNLMTARNLGVVFGPTLMRSRDPGAEFSDMAGKALSVEWFIENAPRIFPHD
ncbi:RhoGAP-domain-containing protein [Mycena rebaudengoi]|nr:RhoGAP-domain-containing protein [Mycena rebaudengoi]